MYILHIQYPSTGYVQTLTFPDAFSRALHMILLATQPVTLRVQDPVTPCVEVALVPATGAVGPVVDVMLVPKVGAR